MNNELLDLKKPLCEILWLSDVPHLVCGLKDDVLRAGMVTTYEIQQLGPGSHV